MTEPLPRHELVVRVVTSGKGRVLRAHHIDLPWPDDFKPNGEREVELSCHVEVEGHDLPVRATVPADGRKATLTIDLVQKPERIEEQEFVRDEAGAIVGAIRRVYAP